MPSKKPNPDPEALSDEDLLRRYQSSQEAEIGEELSRRCLRRLEKTIDQFLSRKKTICPDWIDRNVFAQEALSRAAQHLLKAILTFQFRGSFDGWLAKLGQRAVLDQRRWEVGRRQNAPPRQFVPLEDTYQSTFWVDTAEPFEQQERSRLVSRLLRMHAQESVHATECVGAIKLYLWKGYTIRRIADELGTYERAVFRLFEENYTGMYRTLVARFGISSLRHI